MVLSLPECSGRMKMRMWRRESKLAKKFRLEEMLGVGEVGSDRREESTDAAEIRADR